MHENSTTPQSRSKRANHADRLWGLCRDFTLFSTANGQTFAQPISENCQGLVFPINHPRFRQALLYQYTRNYSGCAPSKAALNATVALAHDRAVNAIDRNAAPGLRIAAPSASPAGGASGKAVAIHGNHYGEAWEINSEGISIGENFLFYQGRGELPLPKPHPEPSPTAFADFVRLLRLASETDWRRCLLWLLAAFRPQGPYPILILQGSAQCGKSHAARLLRACVDPNRTPLLPLPSYPKKLRDLACEHWILAFDHVTRFPRRVAESLARLTENEIFYLPPKDDPTPLSLARPIILTVAESCYIPPEIFARALFAQLLPLAEVDRKTQPQLTAAANELQPHVLSHLLRAVKAAVVNYDPANFPSLPRLPDAFVWAAAAAPALETTPEAFRQVLSDPPNPLVEKVLTFIQTHSQWKGTATQLAAEIGLDCPSNHFSRQLFQTQDALKQHGLTLIRDRSRFSRSIHIAKVIEQS